MRGLIVALACGIAALCVSDLFLFGVLFVLGAGLIRYEPRVAILEGAIPQWLGRISYPLYLSHWLVLHHVNGPILLRLLFAFAVADVLASTVERYSIALSRKI